MNATSASNRARALSKDKLYGVLATQSSSMPGYPFGSLVQYCFDNNGDILMYLSDLAQHTKNIKASNKASVTIVADNPDNIQNSGRVTILGDVEEYNDADGINIYTQFFPESREYNQTESHGFRFYRMKIVRVRYIGGFGDIHWVKSEDFAVKQVFNQEQLKAVLLHMNQDHTSALKKYLGNLAIEKVEMVHFDQEGMWLKADVKTCYVPFEQMVADTTELRQLLIKMAN